MSSSKDSGGGVSKNVLTLEGTSNYHAWLATIQSFLMTLKVWRIASGKSTCPAATGPDQNTWLDLDYQAVGVILLYVKEDLRTAVVLTDPSAKIAHLVELFARLSGAGLVLPDNLKAILLCTGLGDNYASLVTTTVHTIGTTEFTSAKLIPMILAESQ